jgi:SEC-C motif
MGAIGEAIMAFTKPLLDATDGSLEQMNKALALGQVCWNLAVTPADAREELIQQTRMSLKMDDAEFDDFRRSVVNPMIRRHEDMFPRLHDRQGRNASHASFTVHPLAEEPPSRPGLAEPTRIGKFPGTRRNDRCPCNSGRKYKVCCGRDLQSAGSYPHS